MAEASEEVMILEGQRQVARNSVTKELDKLAKLLDDATPPSPSSLNASIAKLESLYDQVVNLNEKIVRLLKPENLQSELSGAGEFHEVYLDDQFFVLRNRVLAVTDPAPTPPESRFDTVSEAGGGSVSFGSVHRGGRAPTSVKLPKLEIRKFDGDPTKWSEFWDAFEATIHENGDLSDVDKFKYLKSFLSKDALRVVEGYKLTSANYLSVVDYLQDRYGNPESAIFQHFEQLLAVPVAPSNDLKALQAVYDDCERHIRSLVALGLEEDTFGRVFTPIILSKLPKFVRIDLHRQNGTQTWTLSNLRTLLRTEIQVREMSQFSFGTSGGEGRGPPAGQSRQFGRSGVAGHRRPGVPPGTGSGLVGSGGSKMANCAFCGGEHAHESCPNFTDSASRRDKVKGRCFICLKSDHMAKACKSRKHCKHCNSQWHHSALCNKKYPGANQGDQGSGFASRGPPGHGSSGGQFGQGSSGGQFGQGSSGRQFGQGSSGGQFGQGMSINTKQPVAETSLASGGYTTPTHMQTAVTSIRNHVQPAKSAKGRLIFDTASSRTYITKSTCKKIGAVPVDHSTVSTAAFQSRKRFTQTYPVVSIDIVCSDGSVQTVSALVTDHICEPAAIFPVDFESHPDLKGAKFAEPTVDCPVLGDIDILVGGDHYYEFITGIRMMGDGLVLLTSKLGLVLAGNANFHGSGSIDSSLVCTMLLIEPVSEPNFDVERMWSLDSMGITDPPDVPDDDAAMSQFLSTVQKKNGRYEVTWPMKFENPDLPTNFQLSAGRLNSLLKRASKDPSILPAYSSALAEQESLGIIERVPLDHTPGRVHYLPHHHVVRVDAATTKLRIVYDASARASKTSLSLNDCLYRGPVLLSDLCGLLLRFRLQPIGIIADLEKAFLQLSLRPDQRDLVRFLWVSDAKTPSSTSNIIAYRFCRVPFGVISSPFLLAATIKYHLEHSDSPMASKIDRSVYVDNLVCCTSTVSEASNLYIESKRIFGDASMNLREWYTNDPVVRGKFSSADVGHAPQPKVLGLRWNTGQDLLSTQTPSLPFSLPVTKRKVLQGIARLYDPIGLYSPVTLQGKCLVQELWRKEYDWDTPLPAELANEWSSLIDSLLHVSKLSVPRYVGGLPGNTYELHCFCDASGKAYSAVFYLLVRDGNSFVSCSLIFAKTKVAPVKQLTIPRLELMAVVIGCRILRFIRQELGITPSPTFIWSDSTCVLHWIDLARSPETLAKSDVKGRFVRNRLSTIVETPDVHFRHVPSKDNPADLGSRGCTSSFLAENELWWHGPEWLASPERWPPVKGPGSILISMPAHDFQEDVPEPAVVSDQLCDIRKFSSLVRLLRVTAWVFRFAKRECQPKNRPLTAMELRRAEKYWVKAVQEQAFSGVLRGLQTSKPDHHARVMIHELGLFLNAGLIRSRGRFGNSGLPDAAKNPILLPANHHFTDLVILDTHRNNLHVGVNQTLAEVRYTFWIPQGRAQVKRVLRKCVACRKVSGAAYQPPQAPALPECRVVRQDPFAVTGLDYLGPLYVEDTPEPSKVWIVLFTCGVIRAVHLEVVPNLSAEHFLLALRRFVSHHSKPDIIISDNATQLHASHRALVRLLQENQEIGAYSSSHGISWKFIPEVSPWMGGFYERMVGTVKTCMKKAVGKRLLSLIELQTVVTEIQDTVNSRPLTYVGDDMSQPLTPAHFLAKRGREGLPTSRVGFEDSYVPDQQAQTAKALVHQWRQSQKTADDFWSRWEGEYLLSLRERSEKLTRSSGAPTAREGSVVLIKENLPRGQWRLGRIAKLNPSADGKVRSAVVTVASGKNLVRPLKALYPVEFSDIDSQTQTQTSDAPSGSNTQATVFWGSTPQTSSERPRRNAAAIASIRIQDLNDTDTQ